MRAAVLCLALAACAETKQVAGTVGGTVAEFIACPVIPGLDCGHVFVCATPADNELGLIEICIDDDNDEKTALADAEAVYGACEPTPRHQGLCIWCPDGKGSNAFNGSFGCPVTP